MTTKKKSKGGARKGSTIANGRNPNPRGKTTKKEVNPHIFAHQPNTKETAKQYKAFLEWATHKDYPLSTLLFSKECSSHNITTIATWRKKFHWDRRASARDAELFAIEQEAARKIEVKLLRKRAKLKAEAIGKLSDNVVEIMETFIAMTVPDADGKFKIQADGGRVAAIKLQLAIAGIQPEDVQTLIIQARPNPAKHVEMTDVELDRELEFYEDAIDYNYSKEDY